MAIYMAVLLKLSLLDTVFNQCLRFCVSYLNNSLRHSGIKGWGLALRYPRLSSNSNSIAAQLRFWSVAVEHKRTISPRSHTPIHWTDLSDRQALGTTQVGTFLNKHDDKCRINHFACVDDGSLKLASPERTLGFCWVMNENQTKEENKIRPCHTCERVMVQWCCGTNCD